MNTAVLYSKTFKKYKNDKCPTDPNCIFSVFDGQDYFNNYILNTKGKIYFKEYKKQRNIYRLGITFWGEEQQAKD